MWEPMGPLPAAVYWRRRWVAVGSAVTVIVLIAWVIAALSSTPDEPGTARPASRAAVSAPHEASPPPAAPPSAALLPATLPATAQLTTATQPGAVGSTPPTPSATESGSATPTPTSSPVPSTTEAPPADPVPCTNEMIAVKAEVDGPEQHVGERMVLRLVVTNSSDEPCVRDLDPGRQEIVVWSSDGSERLWSSNDCSSAKGADLRTLAPGEPVSFSVRWAGRTSAAGCPERREPVPPGEYRLLTRVDDVISPPTQFVRNP
jgi:hypothetical protein